MALFELVPLWYDLLCLVTSVVYGAIGAAFLAGPDTFLPGLALLSSASASFYFRYARVHGRYRMWAHALDYVLALGTFIVVFLTAQSRYLLWLVLIALLATANHVNGETTVAYVTHASVHLLWCWVLLSMYRR